ncbi:MAG: MFS transporter [Thermoproteota archaeon]
MLGDLHQNVRILLLTTSIMSLSFGLSYPYLSEYIYGISGSASMIGTIISTRSAVCILALILGGYLGDKLGRKRTTGIGTILLGVAQLIYASALGTQGLFAAAICEGLSAIYFPSFNAIIMDTTAQDHLTRVFTLSFIVEHIPYTLTPVLGGFMRDSYGILGLRWGFVACGVATVIMGLVRVRLLSETISGSGRVNLKILWEAYRSLPRDFLDIKRKVRQLVLLRSFCLITAISIFYYFAVLYATRYTQALSFTEWGLITAIASFFTLLSLPLSNIIGGSRLIPLYSCLIFIEGLAVAVFIIQIKLTIAISIILLNICGAVTYAIERGVIARETERGVRARAETFMILSYYLGDALGSYIGGIVYALYPPIVFPTAFMLLVIGSIFGFITLKNS